MGVFALWKSGAGVGRAADAPGFAVREIAASPVSTEFTEITSLAVDSRGRIYVDDFGSGRVTVLSPEAVPLRTIGRKGSGPGEFQSIRGVQILPGDSLLVYDPSLGRVTVFPPDSGRAAYVVNLLRGGPPFQVQRTRANDAFLAMYREPFRTTDRPSDHRERRDVLRVLSLDGAVRNDALLAFPSRAFLTVRHEGALHVTPHPFGREGIYRLGPDDRVHYAWTDTLGVETHRLDGGRAGGFSAGFSAPRVTGTDVDSAIAGLTPWVQPIFRATLEDSLPERWPAVRDMLVDDRGRVWLSLATPSGEPPRWSVFDVSGARLGSVTLPAGTTARRVLGKRMYATRTNDMDVPQVVVFAIEERSN